MTVGDVDFSGRVVLIWSKEPLATTLLENVGVRQLGGNTFLVGQIPRDGNEGDPRVGPTFWLPVDRVLELIEFPNVQAALDAYGAQEKFGYGFGKKKSGWLFWQ